MLKLIPHHFRLSQLSGTLASSVRKVCVLQFQQRSTVALLRKYSTLAVARRNNGDFCSFDPARSLNSANLGTRAIGDSSDKSGRKICQSVHGNWSGARLKSPPERLLIARCCLHQHQRCYSVACETRYEPKASERPVSPTSLPEWASVVAQEAHIDKLIATYLDMCHTYWSTKDEALIPVSIDGDTFPCRVIIDHCHGNKALFSGRHISRAVLQTRDKNKHDTLFLQWHRILTPEQRSKHFRNNVSNARKFDCLTREGAEAFLSRNGRRYPEAVRQIRGVFVQWKLFNPFAEMASSEKPEQTMDDILSILRRYLPAVEFTKEAIPTPGGARAWRIPDAWCEQYGIVIECDENDHRYYDENHDTLSQVDIEASLERKILFLRYNPQDKSFSVAQTAERFRSSICAFLGEPFAEPLRPEHQHPQNTVEFPLAKNAEEHINVTDDKIQSLKQQIDREIAHHQAMLSVCVRQCVGICGTLSILLGGIEYQLKYTIERSDSEKECSVRVSRVDLSDVVGQCNGDPAGYAMIYNDWHDNHAFMKITSGDYFAPETQADCSRYRIGRSIKQATKWMLVAGVESFLSYYRQRKLTAVKAVRDSLIAGGLLSKYRQLPILVAVETEAMRQVMPLVRQAYPDFAFHKTFVRRKSGRPRFRRIDACCQQLKLIVQFIRPLCGRLRYLGYTDASYWQEWEDDIRIGLGEDYRFYYVKLYSIKFNAEAEANGVKTLIAEILKHDALHDLVNKA